MLSRPLIYLHAHAPPTPGGTPVLMHRLLSGLDTDELEVVTDRALRPVVQQGGARVLQAPYHFTPRKSPRGNRYVLGRALNAALNICFAAAAGVRAAVLSRRRRAGWVLTVADEGFSVIAGAVCSRLTGLPHIVMVFDLWEENAYTGAARRLARLLEPRIFRSAARILVHNEQMAAHYRAKHGLACAVLPTSVEPEEPSIPLEHRPGSGREVLFAGAVYWAQEDALRRLSRAIQSLDDVHLTILGSAADEAALGARGITADRLEPEITPGSFRRRLEEADVLFLGLGLETDHPEVIRTASPAKLPEYMAAGRPILVHAPADSFVSRYAREYGFAEVADTASETELRAALVRLLEDEGLAAKQVARARELARQRHGATHVREEFSRLLEELRR